MPSPDLCKRDVRALTEPMTVLDDTPGLRGADGMYAVVSASVSQYTVDALDKSCTCPDAQRRDCVCKHQRRVMFAVGMRPIPAWVDRDGVDDHLGEHVNAMPRVHVTDGGLTHRSDGGADDPAADQDDAQDGREDADNDESHATPGLFCSACEAFRAHATPVNTGHDRTGETGCPECGAVLQYVVDVIGDEHTVGDGYIPTGQRGANGSITIADADAAAVDVRPDDCECVHGDAAMPCFVCRMDGFNTPNDDI